MKRTVLLLIFGTLAISCIYGQKTYYYKHVEIVEADGEKRKPSGRNGGYITFTDGMKTCYQSDENGYRKDLLSGGTVLLESSHRGKFHYQKSQDGTLVFDDRSVEYSPFGPSTTKVSKCYYFNSDYSKLVVMSPGEKSKQVYERASGPYDYDEDIPVF
jgi:hypothetical protein